jgi:spermidine synthase
MTRLSRLSLALLVLFVLSGFAGLAYQSVWSHYLGLTLGHAAYAQTLVLAIFMGGMAVGAWGASRYSVRWRQLILGYAIVEGVIGLCGLAFHPFFAGYTGLSQQTILPMLGNPTLAHGYQWLSAALIIAPQSILLGATFPLMSAGLIRAMPNQHGEVLGGLYFSNSLGAACGALATTFVLLPLVGLPGTVMTAGLLNIVVALFAWLVAKQLDERHLAPVYAAGTSEQADPGSGTPREAQDHPELRRLGRILLWSTAVSGAASFVYEVGWVRLLNQALGTTIHSFELMLAAFILGLAFGGLWIRKRAASIAEPVRYVGYVQVWMAVAALLSIPVFTQSFHWVGWIMEGLARTGTGYTMYELATAAISLLVMFPAAFLAGMTLPLFTLALLRGGAGERAIGRIYAANTLGAIAGVALAMHVLIPVMGVRLAVTFAAVVDGLVGVYLLRMVNPARLTRPVAASAFVLVAAIAFGVLYGRPDPLAQASGVFRTGRAALDQTTRVDYLRDGKTATVAVYSAGDLRTISTNGKPDASLTPLDKAPTPDEITMIMAGALPLALHPDPKRVAIIGWGSGLTTHTLLGSPVPEVVDTIEIERAMVDGASLYGERVARAYIDPRSNIRIEDARTFFSTGRRTYDAIISEPSNPWVSGVASLFTQEFYAFLKRHLDDDGVLVQWVHTYEIDDALLGTMMAALVAEFPYADLYLTNSVDLLIVARKTPGPDGPSDLSRHGPQLVAELRRVGLASTEEVNVRRLGSIELLRNFVRMTGARPHSDYYPTVSLNAPRTRFMNSQSSLLTNLVTNGLPVLDVLECRRPLGSTAALPEIEDSVLALWQHIAAGVAHLVVTGDDDGRVQRLSPESMLPMDALLRSSGRVPTSDAAFRAWTDGVASLARGTLGHLPPQDLQGVWFEPAWLSPALAADAEVRAILDAYAAAARRDVARMRASAEAVLAYPAARHSPRMREQMLVLAMLGALGTGDAAGVAQLDQRWAASVGGSAEWTPVRSYLMAWADGPVPACMATAGARASATTGGGGSAVQR